MSFERNFFNNESKEKRSLYQERQSIGVEKHIARIQKAEKGEGKLNLSEEEKENLVEFENAYAENLENAFDIKINSFVFHLDYLQTTEGRTFFRECMGFDVEGESLEEIEKFIFGKRQQIANVDGKMIEKFLGNAREYIDEKLLNDIASTIDVYGNISINGISNPERVNLYLNPESSLEKIKALRDLKNNIKETLNNFGESEGDLNMAKQKILRLYQKRINELICEQFPDALYASKLKDILGEDSLSDDEKELLQQFHGMENFIRTYARFDRFVNGVSGNFDEKGNYEQIGQDLVEYFNEIEKMSLENEELKQELSREKGLDYRKLALEKTIENDKVRKYAEAYFEAYGEKSSQPAEEYDPKRKGAAPDGKWQFVTAKRYSSMTFRGKMKAITAPIEKRSIENTLAVVLGHEMTHFVQSLNQEHLPLRMYKKVHGDRRLIFSEAGAMAMQNMVTSELFGYKTYPHVHYFRAMQKRLSGGDYLECVKASYESALKALNVKASVEAMGEEEFKKEAKKQLKKAISRVKGLFKSGESYSSKSSVLTKSKDLVYLEQFMVMDKLKQNGLEKYAYVRGLNMDSLATLAEIGLLDDVNIKLPDFGIIEKIWEAEKENYKLDA